MRKDLTPGGTAPRPGDSRVRLRRRDLLLGTSLCAAATALPSASSAQPSPISATKRPNILVIMADDVGWFNVGAYNKGMMHYKTPNIDRLAQEGVLFTDYYGEQSCTAGRSAFITGQSPFRTGLTKVGLPGSKTGLQPQDPTIAEMLKPFGYATGQFGKNHLGDRDEFLPTAHGFDEFFGNLYHLNAEEEPENPDYPKSVEFKERFGPRGVLHSYADGRIEDTGPLTMKRMETVDEEFLSSSLQFIDRAHASDTPFFVWFNSSRMHIFTHLKPASEGKTGLGVYADGMVEHDGHVGQLLKKLDDLGIADDTIVLYTTDNGAETFSWPDGGTTPFRGEKNTNWEGGYRVPALLRWPGTVRPGTVSNEVTSALDWFPTFVAAAGAPGVKEKLLAGYVAGGKTFKVHLDGYDLTSALKDAATAWPRKEFFYFSDDGDLVGLRYLRWKAVFAEQRAIGFDVWQDPLIPLRVPKLFDLWGDPFERADHESSYYADWRARRVFLLVPAQAFVAQFLQSFKEFPPRQKPPSFSIDQVLQKLQAAQTED
jgi:arylsulfatase